MGEHTSQHARGLFLTYCWPETDWIVLIFQNLLHNMSDNLDVRNFCPPTLRVIQSPPPALAILQSKPTYALKRFELFIAVTLASLVSLFKLLTSKGIQTDFRGCKSRTLGRWLSFSAPRHRNLRNPHVKTGCELPGTRSQRSQSGSSHSTRLESESETIFTNKRRNN